MTRIRKVLLGAGITAVLLGGAAMVLPRLLFGDGQDYSQVVSIRGEAFQDPALLARAFQLPVAALYQRGGLDFQRNPSFCGPTSVVDVLRSLGRRGEQSTILEGSGISTTFGVILGGLTLDREAALARRQTGRPVTVLRDLDLATFREHMRRSNDPARRYIVNLHRGPLFGRGGGHHSPIGGYLADQDLVLVLDVNRAFQPWLVKTARLFAAVDTTDPDGGHKRGLVLIE